MVVGSVKEDFYPVEQLCNTVKKFIRSLPAEKRYLDGNTWWVHKSSLLEVLRRAKLTGNHSVLDYSKVESDLQFTIDTILFNKKRKLIIPTNIKDSPYAVLHLQETAPRELVDAAFKTLAKLTHPDCGGDPEMFLRVKAAYDLITLKK